MKGTKRLAQADSNVDPIDSPLKSKSIMAASPFDFNWAEPSRVAERPPLDIQRAQSSRLHVRALNTQFASWVQSQLQDHPDELWEDGVQDYLTHASQIRDKFSDVVAWLKVNAAKAGVSTFGSYGTENMLAPVTKNSEMKFQPPNNCVFAQVGSTSSFISSWSASVPSNSTNSVLFGNRNAPPFSFSGNQNAAPFSFSENQNAAPFSFSGNQNAAPFSFSGNQNTAPTNYEASDDPDGEDELERPSSPSVKKAEEKGIDVVHEVKCKLYIKSIDPADKDSWKDRGMGQLSIKCKEGVPKATKESKPTIVVRNDVGKVLLNALIYPGIKTNLLKNAIAAIFHTSDDDGVTAHTYLIRTKTEDDRNKLASAIQEYAPTAKG